MDAPPTHPHRPTTRWLGLMSAATLALLSPFSCQRASEPPPPQTSGASAPAPKPRQATRPGTAGAFFDEDKLLKGSEDPDRAVDEVPCAGATADGSDDRRFHPRKIRGTVYAPFGTYARRGSPGGSPWLNSAHAHPLSDEKPASDVEVRLVVIDAAGEIVKGPLLTTRTDDQGRYCFRIPDGIAFGPTLLTVSGSGDAQMRRSVVSRSTNDIFLQPEALLQILIERRIDLTRLPRSEFGNLYSMTDTVVDDRTHPKPLDLAPGMTIQPGVAMVRQRLLETERFNTKLTELASAYGRP